MRKRQSIGRTDLQTSKREFRSPEGGRQRGVALIVVVVFLTMLLALVTEHATNSTVNYAAAVNARDTMRSEFLNRSGANLAQLIIRVQTDALDKNRKMLGDMQISEYIGFFMGAFGGSEEEVKDMSASLGGFAGEAIEGLGVSAGQFDLQISSEDGKLNMNCANGSDTSRKNLRTQLAAMVFFEAYDPIFEKPDADGWQRTREEQVDALMDYIDTGDGKFGQRGVNEDYGYENLKDPYKPKDNYIDTISELKLVRGVDDRFWTLFGSQFTVYGDCKLNIANLQDPRLIAAVIALAAQNPNDPVVADSKKLWALAQRVSEARSLGMLFKDVAEFAKFVKDPNAALQELLGGLQEEGSEGLPNQVSPGAQAAAEAAPPVEGVALDSRKLGQVASAGARRLYRVEVTSTFGEDSSGNPHMTRKLTAIWDTKTTNQNMRKSVDGTTINRKGAWVYWRED